MKFKTTVTGGCPTYASTISIPRHYYTVAFVEFCQNVNVTANAQWKGFGVNIPAGTCQSKNDFTTFTYVHYGTFTRVTSSTTAAHSPSSTRIPGFRARARWAQEMTNYANWYVVLPHPRAGREDDDGHRVQFPRCDLPCRASTR